MKKGITAYPDYDRSGCWMLKIEKSKGKLTLEEIREAAREYECDFYLLVVDSYHDPNDVQYGEQAVGDLAILYRSDVFSTDLQEKKRGENMAITLKAARVNAGLTRNEASKLLGISSMTLKNYEKNKTKPNIEIAEKIAKLYGTTLENIIFFTK